VSKPDQITTCAYCNAFDEATHTCHRRVVVIPVYNESQGVGHTYSQTVWPNVEADDWCLEWNKEP
jgi:hypothetical protein